MTFQVQALGTLMQVAEPVFNPPGGSFDTNDPVTVTITTTTPGANIRYTLDRSTPTTTHGTLISASSGTASVTPAMYTHPTQLQAVAFKAGQTTSAVHLEVYSIGGDWGPCYPVAYDGCDGGGLNSAIVADSSMSMMVDPETDTANAPVPVAVYLYAGDQIIENVTTGNLYFQDSLGNTSHVTDAAGNLLESYTYDAFGTPTFYNATSDHTQSAPGLQIKHLFQGQLWTQETGLNDYRNRVELPTMGVFLQPDPIGFKGDAANVYRFCNNNAVNRTDPMGLVDRNWDQVRQAMDNCNLIGFFQGEADTAIQLGGTIAVINAGQQMEGSTRTDGAGRRDMAGVAEDIEGSDKYHNTGFFRNVNHCNALIHDAAQASGRTPPMVWVPGFPEGFWRPATSHELADPNVKIPRWTNPRPVSEARRNDIIAQQHGKWGHTGIVTGPGRSISVNTDKGGIIEQRNWGFRQRPGNGEKPGDPSPIVRHYIAGSGGEW